MTTTAASESLSPSPTLFGIEDLKFSPEDLARGEIATRRAASRVGTPLRLIAVSSVSRATPGSMSPFATTRCMTPTVTARKWMDGPAAASLLCGGPEASYAGRCGAADRP